MGKVSHYISRTNVASVGSALNDTRKVKVLSLPENDKGKIDISSEGPSLLTPDEGTLLETSIFRLSFQVAREPLLFAYQITHASTYGFCTSIARSECSV